MPSAFDRMAKPARRPALRINGQDIGYQPNAMHAGASPAIVRGIFISGSEIRSTGDVEVITREPTLWLPTDAGVEAWESDRFVIDGATWEVVQDAEKDGFYDRVALKKV